MDMFEFKAHMSKYTDAWRYRLQTVFEKHCNRENWKYPFYTATEDEEEKDMLVEAISFFLADEATVTPWQGGWVIYSRGYQAW